MCGFVGVLKYISQVDQSTLARMASALSHRGPDDLGVWVEENIGLAHTRLSIHDLSEHGASANVFSG